MLSPLCRFALECLQRLAVEAVGPALRDHVDDDARGSDRDVLRAARHQDVVERARVVVVHREPDGRWIANIDSVEELRVLTVRRSTRREGTLQSRLVAAHVRHIEDQARDFVLEDVPDVFPARRVLEEQLVEVDLDVGARGINDRRFSFDCDFFSERADLHPDLDNCGLTLADDDVLAGHGLEPLERCFGGIGADRQPGDLIHATGVRDADQLAGQNRARDCHRHSRDNRSLIIDGLDRDAAGLNLRRSHSRGEHRQHKRQQDRRAESSV